MGGSPSWKYPFLGRFRPTSSLPTSSLPFLFLPAKPGRSDPSRWFRLNLFFFFVSPSTPSEEEENRRFVRASTGTTAIFRRFPDEGSMCARRFLGVVVVGEEALASFSSFSSAPGWTGIDAMEEHFFATFHTPSVSQSVRSDERRVWGGQTYVH
ncbi:hypothetical protein K440DRAFT_204039 [Wilcoxina mikolae CBS 423.85]|nr:hypothetical protein K440DRAFT_204039 [Wilcoxina mikolae CBS 423.85]